MKNIKCEMCGKYFSERGIGTHRWRVHGEGVDFKPTKGKTSQDKGLTKNNSDIIKKISENLKLHNEYRNLIDDDGKIYKKYENKKFNARKENIDFELSFSDYCRLVFDTGLKSSQLGFSGEYYVLARYNDEGPYKIGNCRFVTQLENSHEKKNYHKNIRFCKSCGKQLSRQTTNGYCFSCYNEFKRNDTSGCPPKEELKEDILKMSFVDVGKKYGVSDNAVRKWCKKYNLPYRKKDIIDMSNLESN